MKQWSNLDADAMLPGDLRFTRRQVPFLVKKPETQSRLYTFLKFVRILHSTYLIHFEYVRFFCTACIARVCTNHE
jgi:hypothetical protein